MPDAGVAECRPAIGRPRSPERHRAILDAAVAALIEEGYDAMSIEGIAARAAVGKATVYRRWRNKAELVVEALEHHHCKQLPLVETDDARADLLAFLEGLAETLNSVDGKLMAVFVAERIRHPELQAEFDRVYLGQRRAQVRRIIERAVSRGDLPACTDVDLLADVGPALLWHRATMRNTTIPRTLPARIVEQFFSGQPVT